MNLLSLFPQTAAFSWLTPKRIIIIFVAVVILALTGMAAYYRMLSIDRAADISFRDARIKALELQITTLKGQIDQYKRNIEAIKKQAQRVTVIERKVVEIRDRINTFQPGEIKEVKTDETSIVLHNDIVELFNNGLSGGGKAGDKTGRDILPDAAPPNIEEGSGTGHDKDGP